MNAKRGIRQLAALLLAAVTVSCAQTALAKDDPKTRLAKAEAMFAERCKKAGVFIHRTAENVEGILLMKIRPDATNYDQQYELDDPYGHDVGGIGLINSFLQGRNQQGSLAFEALVSKGYRYVEAIDPKDGKRYRYTGSMKVIGQKNRNAPNVRRALEVNPNFDLNKYAYTLDKVPAPGPAPRYGVIYDDISTREDRDYWIAGSSLKVTDLQTNEVMAERIGYMMDRGQGNTSGGRAPWLLAARNACPPFPRFQSNPPVQLQQTRYFVEAVLHIKQEK